MKKKIVLILFSFMLSSFFLSTIVSAEPNNLFYSIGAKIFIEGPYSDSKLNSIFYGIGANISIQAPYTTDEPEIIYYSIGAYINVEEIYRTPEPDAAYYSLGAKINIEAEYPSSEPNTASYSLGAKIYIEEEYSAPEPDTIMYGMGAKIFTQGEYTDAEPNILCYSLGGKINILDFSIHITTKSATGVEQTNATLQGNLINDISESCTVRFQYGLTSEYGTNTTNQTILSGNFSQALTGLEPGETYHYRAYANNSDFQVWGTDKIFITEGSFANITITPFTWNPSAGLGENNTTGLDVFTINNTGNLSVDITINASNTDIWTITTSPGHDQFHLQWSINGTWHTIGLSPSSFINTLNYGNHQDFGLKIYMPTTSSTSEKQAFSISFIATAD